MKTWHPKKNKAILLIACSLALTSCAAMTVDGRIQENYDAYNRLTPVQQTEVKAGRVAVGMPESAVYMALGEPGTRVERVNSQGEQEQMWIYSRLEPVPVWPVNYYPMGYGWASAPQWVYQKEPSAKIIFRNGKVISWEQTQP